MGGGESDHTNVSIHSTHGRSSPGVAPKAEDQEKTRPWKQDGWHSKEDKGCTDVESSTQKETGKDPSTAAVGGTIMRCVWRPVAILIFCFECIFKPQYNQSVGWPKEWYHIMPHWVHPKKFASAPGTVDRCICVMRISGGHVLTKLYVDHPGENKRGVYALHCGRARENPPPILVTECIDPL